MLAAWLSALLVVACAAASLALLIVAVDPLVRQAHLPRSAIQTHSFATAPQGLCSIGDGRLLVCLGDTVEELDTTTGGQRVWRSFEGALIASAAPLCSRTIAVVDRRNHRALIVAREDGFSSRSIGVLGSSRCRFCLPTAVACGELGLIAVCDVYNHRVVLFRDLTIAPNTCSLPSAPDLFSLAAWDFDNENDQVISEDMPDPFLQHELLDQGEERNVAVLAPDVAYVREVGPIVGLEPRPLCCPESVAMSQDAMYIADTANHRILRVSLESYESVATYPERDAPMGALLAPKGIAYDPFSCQLFVCDSGNNRIQVLSSNLEPLGEIGFGELQSPRALACYDRLLAVVHDGVPQLKIFRQIEHVRC